MAENLEGMIFLGEDAPPLLSDFSNLNAEDSGSFESFKADSDRNQHVVYDRVIFKYKDPTSPPHVKKECAKWFKPGLGAKICVGWTIRYRWLYRIGSVRITTISGSDARGILEDCLKQSAIAAAVAAVVSGGSAAVAAAEVVLTSCLTAKLGDKLVGVKIDIGSSRGDWE